MDLGFIVEEEGSNGLVGTFEDDGETGTLYLCDPRASEHEQGILGWVPVHVRSNEFQPIENEAWVGCSADFAKVASLVHGNGRLAIDDFRAVIEVASKSSKNSLMTNRDSIRLKDSAWLAGFEWTWTDERRA